MMRFVLIALKIVIFPKTLALAACLELNDKFVKNFQLLEIYLY